jgi:hypothetical protein
VLAAAPPAPAAAGAVATVAADSPAVALAKIAKACHAV